MATPPMPDGILLNNPQETAAAAARLTPGLQPPVRIYLSGELGVGKTFFVRALLAALGERGRVLSPSYTLANSYQIGTLTVHHLDCYRLQNDFIGDDLLELVEADSLCLIEWPELARGLPAADLQLTLTFCGEHSRRLLWLGNSTSGQKLALQLADANPAA